MIEVYEAIKQGRRQLVTIPGFLIAGGLVLTVISVSNNYFDAPIFTLILGVIGSLGIGLTWKYYFFSKWLIWAYENVHDVHLLDARATSNGLLNRAYAYKQVQVRKKGEKEITTIGELLNRERNPEILLDKNLPHVLKIRNGINYNLLLVIGGAVLGFSVILKNFFLLIIVAFIFLLWGLFKDKVPDKNKEVILTLSAKGVSIRETDLPWEKIKEWKVVDRIAGRYTQTYLEMKTTRRSKRNISFEISNLEISRRELEYFLDVYHSKYQILNQKT